MSAALDAPLARFGAGGGEFSGDAGRLGGIALRGAGFDAVVAAGLGGGFAAGVGFAEAARDERLRDISDEWKERKKNKEEGKREGGRGRMDNYGGARAMIRRSLSLVPKQDA